MKKRMSRLLAALLATSMIFTAVGCGNNSDPKQSDSDGNNSNSLEGTSITLMASQNWIKDVDRELIKKFKEKTGIEVKVMVTPDNGYDTLLGTTLGDGGEAVDIFMYYAGSQMESLGIPDMALDLSGEPWVDRMEQWAVDANTSNGKLYGFSTWGVDYEGMLYNKTYFEENNLKPAKTWDEFVALCDSILALGKTPIYEPINGVWHAEYWFYAMTSTMDKEHGSSAAAWLNESKNNKIASLSCAKEGLTQLASFFGAKDANGKPKYYTNDGQAEDFYGSYISLTNRETVMMATWSAYAAELAENGSTDEWGMFPIPVAGTDSCVSNGGGVSKYVNKNSQKIDACKAYLEFLAEEENLNTYYAARTDLVTAAFKNVSSVSSTTATKEAVESSAEVPPVRINSDMLYWDPNLYQYFQGFADGTMTPDQFLANMDDYRATMFDTAAGAE